MIETSPMAAGGAARDVLVQPEAAGLARWSAKRRDFLRMMGYGAGAATLGPLVAACGSSFDKRAARVSKADHFRNLVEGLAGRVVACS